mmetsp:Transcript_6513/g.15048  ORF Transcript_6513/g.15048 Transcript_6513/m.15048 type:complete len:359 (+) Transcript_6513:17-1093(+)
MDLKLVFLCAGCVSVCLAGPPPQTNSTNITVVSLPISGFSWVFPQTANVLRWPIGVARSITWQSKSGFPDNARSNNKVTIALYRNGKLNDLIVNGTEDDGEYIWEPSALLLPDTGFYFTVSSNHDKLIFMDSGFFEITKLTEFHPEEALSIVAHMSYEMQLIPPWSRQRTMFMRQVVVEMAEAVNEVSERFEMASVRAGSVILVFRVFPHSNATSVSQVIHEMTRQITDPRSILKQKSLDRAIFAVLGTDIDFERKRLGSPPTDLVKDPPNNGLTAGIVGLVIFLISAGGIGCLVLRERNQQEKFNAARLADDGEFGELRDEQAPVLPEYLTTGLDKWGGKAMEVTNAQKDAVALARR